MWLLSISAANNLSRYRLYGGICQLAQCLQSHERSYAKPATGKKLAGGKVGKVGVAAPKVHMAVETDPNKLCNFLCGGNINKEGSDPPLKPDSEYPEWLWTLRTERGVVPLDQLDEDSVQYWARLGKQDRKRHHRLDKLKYKYQRF